MLKSFFFVRCLPTTGALNAALDTQCPDVIEAVFLAHNLIITHVIFAFLRDGGQQVRLRGKQSSAVFGPGEVANRGFRLGQLLASPPIGLIAKIWFLSSMRLLRNASHLPSGDQRGLVDDLSPRVN